MRQFFLDFDMDLSVIIVSYNTKKLTSDVVNSLYREDQGVSFETIVIDNNSQDGSVEALRAFAKKYSNFKLIENFTNTGFAFANNQGIKIAKGKYMFLLNSDTIVKNGALKKLLDFAKSKDGVGVVAPKLLNGDGTVQPSCLRFPTIKNAIWEYWFNQKGLFEKYAPGGKNPVNVDSVVGAAFLIAPEALKKIGTLDEKYFFYFEDIDYCRRVKDMGLSVYYFPQAEIVHYHGASGKKIIDVANQWRRLIPSSIKYHGVIKHYILFFIMWLGQKWQKFLKLFLFF